jgi:hypothetical protein
MATRAYLTLGSDEAFMHFGCAIICQRYLRAVPPVSPRC